MMRPRATLLIGTVYRGEYIVDPLAVADAILTRRGSRRRRSKVLEPAEPGADRPVRADEGDTASRPDLS
jgi:hypothetical protein